MKKSIVILVIIAGINFNSCKSVQQRETAAKQNVVDAKQDLKDTNSENIAEWKSLLTRWPSESTSSEAKPLAP